MPKLLDIGHTLEHECKIANARCLVIGVSGGPDSLALLHRLVALQPVYGWRLHVAHLDHGLRGRQSADEARFVAVAAAEWGLSATVELRDVGAIAREFHVGLPTAARAARYAFLTEVAFHQAAEAIVVGHQANDQAETILMHVLRGSGPSGLSGMKPRLEWREWQHIAGHIAPAGPALVRPLLQITREEIEAYCADHQLTPRLDPTNESLEYKRGRIRHELLPILETYNPQVVAALSRTGRLSALETDFMQQALQQVWPQLISLDSGAIHLDRVLWLELHPALQRLALREVVQHLRPERNNLSAHQLDLAIQAMNTEQIMHQLPHNLVLHRHRNGWTITVATTTHPSAEEPQLTIDELKVDPHRPTRLPGGEWQLTFRYLSTRPEANLTRWQALLDADMINGQLMLRQRQPGDRLRPAGAPGSRKIQDIMVDMRMPRELRPQWPLLADDEGIIWIAGLLVAERTHPSNDTTNFVLVSLEELSGAP